MTTNTVKHTPTRGPWNFDGNCGGYISDADGVKIGRAYSHADAHVFAAAPDLWAKAYAADTCLSMAFGYARELGRNDEARHINEVQQALRAAISKAEGR